MRELNRFVLGAVAILSVRSVDAGEVFIVDGGAGGSIRHANTTTFDVTTLVPNVPTFRMEVDSPGGHMYWFKNQVGLQRAHLDGSNVETIVSGNNNFTAAIAFDSLNNKVIWNDLSRIFRANPDGSGVEQIASVTFIVQDMKVDPVNQKLYVSDYTGGMPSVGQLRWMNLDGTDNQILIPNIDFGPGGVDVDPSNGRVYYSRGNAAAGDVGEIRSAALDGSDDQLLLTDIRPRDISLDLAGGQVYWNERGTNAVTGIRRASLDRLNVETLPFGDILPLGLVYVPEPHTLLIFLPLLLGVSRRSRLA